MPRTPTPTAGDGVDARPGEQLREFAGAPVLTVFRTLDSSPLGLTEDEAADRLRREAEAVAGRRRSRVLRPLAAGVRSPFVALLSALWLVFVVVGDLRGAVMVAVMTVLAIGLRSWQHTRSDRAVRALSGRTRTTIAVRRRPAIGRRPVEREVPVEDVVTGDVLAVVPGDVLPADVRVLAAQDLTVDQAALSGESQPVPKWPEPAENAEDGTARAEPTGEPSLCLAGATVVTGRGTAVVLATGGATYSELVTRRADGPRPESSFDRGVRAVGRTLIRFMLVMVCLVLAVDGTASGRWPQAALFAAAIAVGLTPELLPVIVTSNLARGARLLARANVLVTRLNAIQDLGAIDVLCMDKTGTLTEDRVVYAHAVDPAGRLGGDAGHYANLAVRHQHGPFDRLDDAIAERLGDPGRELLGDALYDWVREIGFDHARRRATVVLGRGGTHLLISRGDPDEVLARCTHVDGDGGPVPLDDAGRDRAAAVVREHAGAGMRLLAVATARRAARLGGYGEADEHGLVLAGFVGFLDPVRASAPDAVRRLRDHGVAVVVVTGDNGAVAAQVAARSGVPDTGVVLGGEIDAADDAELPRLVEGRTVFARLAPDHKARIVIALRARGHVVGFVGDGVNDAPALRTADVGIAPDTATAVAKQRADLILTDPDLSVLAHGVVEGRRTLGNTLKYVKITASSNFGNVLTVLAAAVFLPFLPMLPLQLVVQNLLYDSAQLALPWDRVDEEYLRAPRRWDTRGLAGFMLVFGTLSSLVDLATFAVLWQVFHAGSSPALFQSGWFVESLLSQLLIVLVLRTRHLPLRGPRPSRPVLAATALAAAIGLLVPELPVAHALHLVALPAAYLAWPAVALTGYAALAQLVKRAYLRRHPTWL